MTVVDNGTDLQSRLTLQYEVEQFYYHEARLLDDRRFSEWMQLFDPDVSYWAPVRVTREGAPDQMRRGELALFDDDYGTLELRVQGLMTKSAWAEIPPSRTRHLISNVTATSDAEGKISALSNFLVFRSRLEATDHTFVGSREDVLVPHKGSFRILTRKILLDHNTFTTDNISVMF